MAKTKTDKVLPLAGFIGAFISALFRLDSDGDGSITFVEILNKVQLLGLRAFSTFSDFELQSIREQIAEIKDIPARRQEVVTSFAKEFDLVDDIAEMLFEDWLYHIEHTITLVQRTRRVFAARQAANA